jgi:8-oxo-dGTP pyrophosphatase MutT (NUDIX family)
MGVAREFRRRAGLIVLDERRRVLLFRGGDPSRPEAGTWWFTPGGGADPGETYEAAARRELFEETGLRCDDLGPVVLRRRFDFDFDGEAFDQDEVYYLVRTAAFDIDASNWTELERRTTEEHRWWAIDELAATSDEVYPPALADLLVAVA